MDLSKMTLGELADLVADAGRELEARKAERVTMLEIDIGQLGVERIEGAECELPEFVAAMRRHGWLGRDETDRDVRALLARAGLPTGRTQRDKQNLYVIAGLKPPLDILREVRARIRCLSASDLAADREWHDRYAHEGEEYEPPTLTIERLYEVLIKDGVVPPLPDPEEVGTPEGAWKEAERRYAELADVLKAARLPIVIVEDGFAGPLFGLRPAKPGAGPTT